MAPYFSATSTISRWGQCRRPWNRLIQRRRFWAHWLAGRQLAFQICGIIVFPDHFLAREWRMPSIMTRGCLVAEGSRAFGTAAQCRQCGPVGDIAGGEQQGASLPCRSASSRSSNKCSWLVPEMLRVPPAPVPHGHWRTWLADTVGSGPCPDSRSNTTPSPIPCASVMACGLWKLADLALQLGEIAIIAFFFQCIELRLNRVSKFMWTSSCLGVRVAAQEASSAIVLHRAVE